MHLYGTNVGSFVLQLRCDIQKDVAVLQVVSRFFAETLPCNSEKLSVEEVLLRNYL